MENEHHLERVRSRHGMAARDHFLTEAGRKGYHLRCSGASFVPHVQFRRYEGQRPYPYSLTLNRVDPVVYIRRPTPDARARLLQDYKEAGAHEVKPGQVKVPLRDVAIAKRLAAELL